MNYPDLENTLLVAVDLQEKILPPIFQQERLLDRSIMLLRGAAELGLDIIVTEQYPKGLGHTITGVSTWLPDEVSVLEKTSFSVFGIPGFAAELRKREKETLIFLGIESHVCVLQSVIDALNSGLRVFVASDAISSRKESDMLSAIETMRQSGATLLSSEALLFLMMRDAKHPEFREIAKLVK